MDFNFKGNRKLEKQKMYYDIKAQTFDNGRLNSNHLYKIERIGQKIYDFKIKNNSGNCKIAELGGGTGIHAAYFLEKYHNEIEKFIFSDISSGMLEQAKEKLCQYGDLVEYIVSSAEEIDLNGKKVDAIYISGAMHHFGDKDLVIRQVRKSLKQDGIVVICEPIISNPYNFIRAVINKEEWGQFTTQHNTIIKILKRNGLTIIENEILHYRSNNKKFSFIIGMEKYKAFNWLGVMFLLVAKH